MKNELSTEGVPVRPRSGDSWNSLSRSHPQRLWEKNSQNPRQKYSYRGNSLFWGTFVCISKIPVDNSRFSFYFNGDFLHFSIVAMLQNRYTIWHKARYQAILYFQHRTFIYTSVSGTGTSKSNLAKIGIFVLSTKLAPYLLPVGNLANTFLTVWDFWKTVKIAIFRPRSFLAGDLSVLDKVLFVNLINVIFLWGSYPMNFR